jgi:DNA mismatch repair protein MutS2
MRVEEAQEEVETYLQIVSETDLGRVFIIHGKGTGALQKAIVNYLKSSPWKKKFRSGRYGEGDLGVTVVVFKAEADEDPLDPRATDEQVKVGRGKGKPHHR